VLALWQASAAAPQRRSGDAGDEAGLRAHVARLSGKFLERTAAQAATLRRLIECLQAGDSSSVASMHAIAHQIHGAGATFDFPAVSECAAEIERLSHQLLAAEPAIDLASDAQIRERLQASIGQLAHAIESAASAATPAA
jgi:HPt (histidine-containing phosphotransfer) domain-containing protein